MIPILYQGNEQVFLHNGLGRLSDAISCIVTEEHNGVFELEMTYPITGIHYADIEVGMIIFAKTEEGGNNQAFIIYKISRPLNGVVTINAEHISYLLNGFAVMPFTGASCADTFSQIPSHMAVSTPFRFYTDIDSSIRYTLSEPRTARNVLGGQKGSILDVYGGGDYKFDNFDVRLLAHRGNDNGVTIRYGKNLTELNNVDDSTNVYTGIVPYWVNPDTGESFYLTEKAVYNEHADDYPYKILRCIDFSSDFETQPTQAQLRAAAESYIEAHENSWKINNNIDVSFVNLSQTEEYKDILALERVRLCDTVTIIYEKLGVDVKTKVIKTVYNVLTEKYDKISLGDTTYSLAKAVQQAIDAPTSEDMTSFIQASIDRATKLIQGGLGGHVVFNTNADGEPEEILIMDTDDIMTAVNVIRMNLNGIGFSHDGYDGPFTTAWTVDGHFVADFIDAGNLNASLLTVGTIKDRNETSYWNLQTGELRISSGAKVGSGNATIGQAMTDISNLKYDVNALDVQISGIFSNYTGDVTPTNSNYPASSWTTEDKPLHVGEVYYKTPQDPDPGVYYRYSLLNGAYGWEVIDTTDGNYAVVTSEFKQTKNEILSTVSKSEKRLFANYAGDVLPTTSNYPASSWTTDAQKKAHENEVYYNTANGKYYKWGAAGANQLKITLRYATETDVDYLDMYIPFNGGASAYKYRFTGGNTSTSSSYTTAIRYTDIPDSSIDFRWYTNSSNHYYGYRIMSIEKVYRTSGTSSPDEIEVIYIRPEEPSAYQEQSAHPYADNQNIDFYKDVSEIPETVGYDWSEIATDDMPFSTVSSQIRQTAEEISLKVSKGEVVSEINLSTDAITLNTAGRLIITAGNFQLDSQGNLTAANATLTGVNIDGGSIEVSNATRKMTIQDAQIKFYEDDIQCGLIHSEYSEQYDAEYLEIESPARIQILSDISTVIASRDTRKGITVTREGVLQITTESGYNSLEASHDALIKGALTVNKDALIKGTLSVDTDIAVIWNGTPEYGVSGSFTTSNKTVTVRHGIITSIV